MIKSGFKKISLKEIIFQIVLNVIVFVFFAFDRRHPEIELFKIYFYLNYAIPALIINYVLLPKYLYKGKHIGFILYSLVLIGIIIFIEEAVLEQIYYPDTRGRKFLGIFHNLMGTMPTLTVLVGFKFAWDALTNRKKMEELKSSAKESELQFLKSQINPHFLFNNLNNLYAYAVEQSPKTPEIILELSAVLRYMLYDCKADFVSLENEIKQIKSYISLSELQIEDRGKVTFKTNNISNTKCIAPLILIVFIENAFKHSSSSQSDKIEIDIVLEELENGTLKFKCKNTYRNQSNIISLDGGIGLENVQKRLELLYPNAHDLKIETIDNECFLVDLTIDLNKTTSK
ncbi:sensor histidine kinase [Brumimicrobium oceani]|uniref:Histidine kinase n=1 Tax=Brumimicrobium oceani TaxID=2100725 RepID=A0A2U2XC63_9FLAO|nr:histidine kinase [Brumimicrobium oceani]PWH85357.1 histidine kinase [Brumimicrobium oceani]